MSKGKLSADQVFAKLVLQQQLATVEQINACIKKQRDLRQQGRKLRLWELMVAARILPKSKAVELSKIDLTPLSCPRCELRFYYSEFDKDQTYTCHKCDGVLVDERARRVTGVHKVGLGASQEDSSGSARAAAAAVSQPKQAPGKTDSGVMALLDVNSLSTDSQYVLQAGNSEEDLEVIAPEEQEDKLCGTVIGGYQILKKLGQGGMGVIYKAEQLSLNRIVALKMLSGRLASNPTYVDRFIHEARSVAKVNNANIIQIYDVGTEGGRCYFSMEYVPGENVGSILDRIGAIGPRKATEIVIQAAEALREAHANGIVHRDIKPDNIMLNANHVAKLADLGIAKTEDVAEEGGSGMQMGTPYYISPEQASDPTNVDIRADIYSLGASFFHMVTGKFPYDGPTPMMVLMKLTNDPVPEAAEVNPRLPYSVSRLIKKMMAKDPGERHQDPAELIGALLELRDELAGKSEGTKLRLQQREVMRIEANDDAGNDLALEFAEEPARPPSRQSTLNARQSSRRLPPKMATSGRIKREPEASEITESQKQMIYGAIGLAALVIIALIAASIFGGSGETGDSGGDSGGDNGGSVVKIPDKPIKIPIKIPVKQDRATTEWAKLEPLFPRSLTDDELVRLITDLKAYIGEFPSAELVENAEARLKEAHKEQQGRGYRGTRKAVDRLLAGTLDEQKFAEAEEKLSSWLKAHDEQHSKYETTTSWLTSIRERSDRHAKELLEKAAKLEPGPAIAALRKELPRLAVGSRKLLTARISAIEATAAKAKLKRQLTQYITYFGQVSDHLARQEFDQAVARAKMALKHQLPEGCNMANELEDLELLARVWPTIQDKLDKRVGGKGTKLQFMEQKAPQTVVIRAIASDRKAMAIEKVGRRKMSELHGSLLSELGGEPIDGRGPLSTMRLAMLLQSLGQFQNAADRLIPLKRHGSFSRFELRTIAWHVSEIRRLYGTARRMDSWALLVIHVHQLDTVHKDSSWYPLLKDDIENWRKRFDERNKLPELLVSWCGRKREIKEHLYWRSVSRAVIAMFPDEASAIERAKRMLAAD